MTEHEVRELLEALDRPPEPVVKAILDKVARLRQSAIAFAIAPTTKEEATILAKGEIVAYSRVTLILKELRKSAEKFLHRAEREPNA